MRVNGLDWSIIVGYFALTLLLAWWKGRGKQASTGSYFFAQKTLPWWVMGAAYVTAGMNTEQLVGMNGVAYTVGLPLVNWLYTTVLFVYSALIFIFFPVYLRNNIVTVPHYLGLRFDHRSENVFSLILLASYIFVNLAVVFYGGAKFLEVILGGSLFFWLIVLAIISGLVVVYGGMSSMVYASVLQFVLIFGAGLLLFVLAYLKLPNGWSDVVDHAPCGFHLFKPTDYPEIPWHAFVLTVLNLQLFYCCINQALVQRGFGGRTEWDVRMAIILAGFAVFFRPFVEVFPGMMARALAMTGHAQFAVGVTEGVSGSKMDLDSVLPNLVNNLIRPGFIGLMVVGILSSVMSTISALLNSISTLFTLDVYKKWIRPKASEKELVQVGVAATVVLMLFGVLYSPLIEHLGGIFKYFQTFAAYVAVPVATVYLFGLFWRRATPAAALAVMLGGIPLGLVIHWTIPMICSEPTIAQYNLNNQFIEAGICQFFCAILFVIISLATTPRPAEETVAYQWHWKYLWLPPGEPKRKFFASVPFWWTVFVLFYVFLVLYLW
ncbi:MAG: sodium/solute symporter [Pirellulales bacterium]|nr:sodium/solute symporter [Pirellulales bacterium]